CQHSFGAPPTF
nr:immunoglobulin light chain junction region [Macaca mulatta]MOW44408.1 immunoglobulin light chain junction region [Macaca mulatta]MOW45398.1 immunoglobulin light chain junction region [Macaca mulatta]